MSEQIKLRECPFCGGEAEINETCFGNTKWIVSCKKCEISNSYSGFLHRSRAIIKWNTRTEDKRIEMALDFIERVQLNSDEFLKLIGVADLLFIKSILKGEA